MAFSKILSTAEFLDDRIAATTTKTAIKAAMAEEMIRYGLLATEARIYTTDE